MRLNGKVAIITGGGSGIGKATAKLFAKEGAKVVVADNNMTTGEEVAQQIEKEGGNATFVRVDIAHTVDVEDMIKMTVQTYGRLDILFNNAGVPGENLEDTTEEKWRRVIDVNLTGPFLACKYAIPIMKKQGGGNIISTSSAAGIKASARSPSYNTSKAGLIMLTKSLAAILGKDNIRVNCICPGPVDTGLTDAFMSFPKNEQQKLAYTEATARLTPLGRYGRPEEISSVVLFLASDESSYITGVAYLVDGGMLA
jgi:NAD(P)-dependent dehydrogenase (short-subunit alcohol dehydrogenase family)